MIDTFLNKRAQLQKQVHHQTTVERSQINKSREETINLNVKGHNFPIRIQIKRMKLIRIKHKCHKLKFMRMMMFNQLNIMKL